jgi:ubiquitin-like-conjugating enzyme ATG3
MENYNVVERIVEGVEGESEGWVTHDTEEDDDVNNETVEMTLDNNKLDELRGRENQNNAENNDDDDDGDEGEAMDMEDFEESGALENVDVSVAVIQPKTQSSTDNNDEDSVVHTRTYDIFITYNKYYQTPHLFLIGYNENRKLLTVESMFEDVSQDNAKKTVTFEAHPHLPHSMLAVHPCKHSELMKKFIQIAEEGGNELSVHAYLIIFLKFVQSVIPTINYDFSQTVKTN